MPFRPSLKPLRLLFLTISLGICLGISLAGCTPNVLTIPIADVQTQAVNQSIEVKGTVITIAPMLNQTAYELQDDRGNSLWILTKKITPKIGDEVTVVGKIRFDSISMGGEELGKKFLEEN